VKSRKILAEMEKALDKDGILRENIGEIM